MGSLGIIFGYKGKLMRRKILKTNRESDRKGWSVIAKDISYVVSVHSRRVTIPRKDVIGAYIP